MSQTMLTPETTRELLSYEPMFAFSGHDHNGCHAQHDWTRPGDGDVITEEGMAQGEPMDTEVRGVTYEFTVRSIMGDFGGHMAVLEMQQYVDAVTSEKKWQYSVLHTHFLPTLDVVFIMTLLGVCLLALFVFYVFSMWRGTTKKSLAESRYRWHLRNPSKAKTE